MEKQPYHLSVKQFRADGYYDVDAGCSDWIAINMGDTAVQINNIVLLPRTDPALSGASFSPDARKDEIYMDKSFNVIFLPPIGSALHLQVIQKIYPQKL